MAVMMFSILLVVLCAVSIMIWEVFHASPDWHININWLNIHWTLNPIRGFIRMVDSSPVLQMIFHFGLGSLICMFIGEGMISGGANLAATVLFPLWCAARFRWFPTPEMREWLARRRSRATANSMGYQEYQRQQDEDDEDEPSYRPRRSTRTNRRTRRRT